MESDFLMGPTSLGAIHLSAVHRAQNSDGTERVWSVSNPLALANMLHHSNVDALFSLPKNSFRVHLPVAQSGTILRAAAARRKLWNL